MTAGSHAPLDINARHSTNLQMGQAKVNRAVLFRRALKLINGGIGNIPTPGLTVVAENPVYVQGDWNYDATSAATPSTPHAATAIIADAVTVLSNAWNDNLSFSFPYTPDSRPRSAQSYYRFAVIAGKNAPFLRSAVVDTVDQDFGTDGGAHNFLRMLEGGGGTVNYRGSIVTFYFSRQAVGVFKMMDGVRRHRRDVHLRHRLPRPGASAAADADVPRRERARLQTGDQARKVGRTHVRLDGVVARTVGRAHGP